MRCLMKILILIKLFYIYLSYNVNNYKFAKNSSMKRCSIVLKKNILYNVLLDKDSNLGDSMLGLPSNPKVALYDEYEYDDEIMNEIIINDKESYDNNPNNIIKSTKDNMVTKNKSNIINNEINEIKEQMKIQLLYAFDNLYEADIDIMLDVIWSSNKNEVLNIRLKLIELTKLANNINNILINNDINYGYENLVDELRIIRSQIRMYSNVPIITNKVFGKSSYLNNNENSNNNDNNMINNIRNWFEDIFKKRNKT